MKSDKQREDEFLDRISYDKFIEHCTWICKIIEKKLLEKINAIND